MRYVLILILFSASLVWATSFISQPFPDSVQDAPNIVHGKIGMSYADWGKGNDGTKRIYTYYELDVEESLKGTVQGPSVSMRELGGEKDGIGMQVPGASHFDRGEDVVVFLGEKNLEGSYDVWGLSMGKYDLQTDDSGQQILMGPGLSNGGGDHADHTDHDDVVHPGEKPSDTHAASAWTLEKLRALIQSQSESKTRPAIKRGSPSYLPNPSISSAAKSPAPTEAPALQNQEDPANGSSGLFAWSRIAIACLVLGAIFWFRRGRKPKN
jgi:hypothetical protein